MNTIKTIGFLLVALVGLVLALVSALLVNAAPANSSFAWTFAISCIVGTWMFVGSLLLIISKQ